MGETTNGSAIGTEVFDLLLSGENPADELTATIRQLSDEDRQTVLCVACAFQAELVSICSARAADFDRLLNSECRFYIDGKRTCGRWEENLRFPSQGPSLPYRLSSPLGLGLPPG